MDNKNCDACGKAFHPRPQAPLQSYCSEPACQRERRRNWQRLKRKTDSDYRDNQARAQKAWSKRNPNYSRQYRDSHPNYAEHNRRRQQQRNALAKSAKQEIAKMDASQPKSPLPSGIYRLSLLTGPAVAKMDVWMAEITVHAHFRVPRSEIAKR